MMEHRRSARFSQRQCAGVRSLSGRLFRAARRAGVSSGGCLANPLFALGLPCSRLKYCL